MFARRGSSERRVGGITWTDSGETQRFGSMAPKTRTPRSSNLAEVRRIARAVRANTPPPSQPVRRVDNAQEAIDAVADANPDWVDQALGLFEEKCRAMPTLIVDDVLPDALERYGEPTDRRAMGAVVQKALRAGYIDYLDVETEYGTARVFVKSQRGINHGSPAWVYRSLLFE